MQLWEKGIHLTNPNRSLIAASINLCITPTCYYSLYNCFLYRNWDAIIHCHWHEWQYFFSIYSLVQTVCQYLLANSTMQQQQQNRIAHKIQVYVCPNWKKRGEMPIVLFYEFMNSLEFKSTSIITLKRVHSMRSGPILGDSQTISASTTLYAYCVSKYQSRKLVECN